MIVQKYRIVITQVIKGQDPVGGLVFKDNGSDEVTGFVSDYSPKEKKATITLFEPCDIPSEMLTHKKAEILSEKMKDDDLKRDIQKAMGKTDSPLRAALGGFPQKKKIVVDRGRES